MSPDKVKNALTGEDWAEVMASDYPAHEHIYGHPTDDPYRMAALCLHDQPFGFTREMVDAVRVLDSLNAMKWDEVKALWVLVRQMTDHVEALLPPEEK